MNRQVYKQIADDTLRIVNDGFYVKKDRRVNIKPFVSECTEETILYGHHHTISFDKKDSEEKIETLIEVRIESTLQAAQQEFNASAGSVVALNFASAKNPGGGFLKGSNAQEESIARSSALYACLTTKQAETYYYENDRDRTCLYTDNIIYSPNVPIFRSDSNGELLDELYLCSIITSPAVNYKVAIERSCDREAILDTFTHRADRVLAIAALNNHDVVILGAWGTGVFGCDLVDVAQMFRRLLLLENSKYRNVFKKVVFAIIDEKSSKVFKRALYTDGIPVNFKGKSGDFYKVNREQKDRFDSNRRGTGGSKRGGRGGRSNQLDERFNKFSGTKDSQY